MKKLVLATMLASAFGLAQAQSSAVEVYGVMDVGIVNANKVGTNNASSNAFVASPMDTSRIGFRATEDLGGGLKAGFNLESQVAPTNGSQGTSGSSGAANNTFHRAANVQLQGGFGKIIAGRQLNNVYSLAYNKSDVRGGKNFGSSVIFWNDNSSFGGTSTAKTGLSSMNGTAFMSNAVRYETPVFAGLSGTIAHVTGGVAGDDAASSTTGVSVDYKNGGLNLVAGYLKQHNSAGAESGRFYTYGGTYAFGKAKVGAGYSRWQNPAATTTANTDFDLVSVSGGYQLTQNLFLSGGYYDIQNKVDSANKAQMYALVADYAFSKRTGIYTGWAQTANKGNMGFSPYGGGSSNINSLAGSSQFPSVITTAGQTQSAFVVGMTHKF